MQRLVLLILLVTLASCGGGSEADAGRPLCARCDEALGGSGAGTASPAPAFTRSGTGPGFFTLPASVAAVRVQTNAPTSAEHFTVYVGGRLVVNEVLGVPELPAFSGSFLVAGGAQVEIRDGAAVQWAITAIDP